MSSSTDVPGLWASDDDVTGVLDTPELRGGTWTRLGDRSPRRPRHRGALDRLARSTVEAARSQGYAVGLGAGPP